MSIEAPERVDAVRTRSWRNWCPRRSWWRWVRRIGFALVGLLVLLVAITAFRVWQVGRQDHRPHSDAILVLGAAQYDGRPSATLKARLDHAYDLYEQGIAPQIVTVGGKRTGDVYTEAQSGQMYLTGRGVPASAITAVGVGSDTLLSLRAANTVLRTHGWHSVVLVTDPWHSLRSRTMARDLGLTAQTSPTRTGPASHGRVTEGRYIARETAAYLYYRVFHSP
ncbi:MAG TPA: YdcF family protein [Mycobacteriales bacterium]|nr:YdcF family protein [Mycobacteriales bacterium]